MACLASVLTIGRIPYRSSRGLQPSAGSASGPGEERSHELGDEPSLELRDELSHEPGDELSLELRDERSHELREICLARRILLSKSAETGLLLDEDNQGSAE
jgi:hypothetical protein